MINIRPYWANFFLCLFRVFSKRVSKNRSRNFECFLKNFVIGSKALRMIRFGMMFPTIPIRNACRGDSPMLIPTGIPRRSSIPGIIDPKNVTVSGVMRSVIIP